MSNAKAVYTARRSITAGKFADVARETGFDLRYLAPGGVPFFRYEGEVPKKGLTNPLNKSLLVTAARDDDAEVLSDLDTAIHRRDRQCISRILNSFSIPWFELYSSRFDYRNNIAGEPQLKDWVSRLTREQLRLLKKAKTRYILYNQSRNKICGELTKQLAAALADHVDGIVLTHKRTR